MSFDFNRAVELFAEVEIAKRNRPFVESQQATRQVEAIETGNGSAVSSIVGDDNAVKYALFALAAAAAVYVAVKVA